MTAPTLEERVAALESRLQQIKQPQVMDTAPDVPRGWQRLVGVFGDNPEFEEAVRLGRAWREAQDAEDSV